ncbi:MAG: 4-alpha-glucanotransferase [Bacillota bacterium]|nr:4-alpha-glucanotransferase [Bacillota bacterium]
MRKSGILLPIFSLPSAGGKGGLGQEAYDFIDKLAEAGQHYWQVLPIGPVNEENCPYQSASSFAGEITYISLQKLAEEGLLTSEEADLPLKEALGKAFDRFDDHALFEAFCWYEREWLDDYALYTALSEHFGTGRWDSWSDSLRDRDPQALHEWTMKLEQDIQYCKWTQYLFFRQWHQLLEYAHTKGIEMIGDLPYFAAFESADCWAARELFMVDANGRQTFLAGAPPDAFTAEGQCWGNPVYDWAQHRAQGYSWWMRRIRQQFRFFDVVRIDHMRGFESFYVIPAETEDPKDGHWEKGPGTEFFDTVKAQLGEGRFIAEDLGYLTEEVKEMVRNTGFPGMKILQFAFDTGEENVYLPFNYDTDNAVVYNGTHDNDTTMGWYKKAEDWKQRFVSWYLREKSDIPEERKYELFAGYKSEESAADAIMEPREAVRGLIEMAFSTRCDTCIISMQDYLMLGSEARINVPGIAEGNWVWQMDEGAFTEELAAYISEISGIYDRKG